MEGNRKVLPLQKYTCLQCNKIYEKQYRLEEKENKKFCSQVCSRLYFGILAKNREKGRKGKSIERVYHDFRRAVWGSTGLMQGEIEKIKSFDYKKYEEKACNIILPKLGFYDIVDINKIHLGFHFDMMAYINGEKVLIDVTTKFSTNNGQKKKLADLFGFDFYMIFISPIHDDMFYLKKMVTSTFKIPQSFFHEWAKKLNINRNNFY